MSDHADTIIQKQYRKGFLSMREYVRPMMMSEAFGPMSILRHVIHWYVRFREVRQRK